MEIRACFSLSCLLRMRGGHGMAAIGSAKWAADLRMKALGGLDERMSTRSTINLPAEP
eukprot:COSAG06_NODE_4851_length_3906_cov_5.089572_3_plen_58_part_00